MIRRFLSSGLSHLNKDGLPRVVDVSSKDITKRIAVAGCKVILPEKVANELKLNSSNKDVIGPKGSIFHTAILAGIMASKKTSDLIPLCHNISLDKCSLKIDFENDSSPIINIECTAITTSKTGVEMEALVGASNAALCIYDMCKALSNDIVISDIQLLSKIGGKS